MAGAGLERFSVDVGGDKLTSALERDGCAIVESVLHPDQLARLNDELDACIAAKAPGVREWDAEEHPLPDGVASPQLFNDLESLTDASPEVLIALIQDFYGSDTVRIDGLPGKSATFVELMCHPLLLTAADHFLLPNCKHYTLNTGQLIEIRPGESAQTLHRDEAAWLHYREARPELTVEAMIALSDFTEKSGATQVVPGSHRWEEARLDTVHEGNAQVTEFTARPTSRTHAGHGAHGQRCKCWTLSGAMPESEIQCFY